MSLAITNTRPLEKNEMAYLHKHVAELWAARAGAAVKVSAAHVKAGYWMAANGFTKLVHKATSPQMEEHLKRGVSLGTAFAAGAFAVSAMVPVLPLALVTAGAVTVGSYTAGKVTQALHNITERDLGVLQTKADNALKTAKNIKETEYASANEEYQDWKNYLGEEYKNRAEQAYEDWQQFKSGVQEDLSEIKSDLKEGWNAFKTNIKEEWSATRDEIKERANNIKQGVQAGIDKVKRGIETGVMVAAAGATVVGGKIKAGAKAVADTIELIRDKDAREEAIARMKREREYSDEAIARDNARIQREADRQAKKQAQAQARQARIAERQRQQAIIARAESINKATKRAERAEEKQAKAEARSQKALNFIVKSTSCLGKDWIASHLLTEEDKQKYVAGLNAQTKMNIVRNNRRQAQIQANLELVNELKGSNFTVQDYENMTSRQQRNIDKQAEEIREFGQEADLTV